MVFTLLVCLIVPVYGTSLDEYLPMMQATTWREIVAQCVVAASWRYYGQDSPVANQESEELSQGPAFEVVPRIRSPSSVA